MSIEQASASRPAILITGAGKRVGAVIASHLHNAGYDLAIHAHRSQAEAAALCAALNATRADSAFALGGDLQDSSTWSGLIEATVGHFGRLDGLINNASAFYPTPIGESTPTHWDELFASNAKAPFFLAQAAALHLRASRGAIINLVDIYAERPLKNHTIYVMAKAALRMLTLSLAKELAPEVRVNAIAPGAILWPEAGKPYADQQELIGRTPLRRAGTPEDLARTVLFLMRDAPYITGEIIKVDGGRSLLI